MTGWDITKIKKRIITEYFSHSRGQNVLVYPERSRRVKIFWTIIGLVLVILVMTFVFRKVLLIPGRAPGVDTRSFTHTAQIIADYWREQQKLPAIDPYWYNDFEIKYVPPLIYPPLILVYFLTGNPDYAGSVVFYLVSLFSGLTMFFAIRKKYSAFNAFLGSLMFALAPLIFIESRTRLLAVAFLPLAFYFTNKLLLEKKKYSSLVILAVILALAVLAHLMHGLNIMAALLIYGFFYLLFSKKIAGTRFFLLLIAPILSLGLIAFYLVPYIIEGGAWTAISAESVIQTSIGFRRLWPMVGIVYVLVSCYSVLRNREPQRIALFVTSLLAAFFSLGIYSPIPIVFSIFRPEVWLFFASFGFVYLTATTIDFSQIASLKITLVKVVAALMILALGLYFSNQFNHFSRFKNPPKTQYEAELLAQFSQNDGRLLPLRETFQLIEWEELAKLANQYSNEGHYYALARSRSNLAWIYDDINYGYPKLAINFLKHQNTRYILLNGEFLEFEKFGKKREEFNPLQEKKVQAALDFLDKLQKDGFRQVYQSVYEGQNLILYAKDEESKYLLPIKEKILIIGSYANTAAAVLSAKDLESVQGGSIYLDDYELDFLKNFDSLILYGFGYHDKKKAEELVKEYSKGGGKVVIDLIGVEKNKLEDLPTFLGVTGIQKNMPNQFSLEKNDNSSNLLPTQFGLPEETSASPTDPLSLESKPLKEWRFMTYLGLDKAVLELNGSEERTVALGYKEIEGNKIWFIGPNLFYHAYLTHNDQEIELLKNLVYNNAAPLAEQNTIDIQSSNLQSELKEFSYQSQSTTPLLISNTYSPHWHAYVDGQKIKVYNIENLMALNLPAGNHNVEMKYDRQKPPTSTYGNWLSISAIIILLLPLIVGWFRKFRKAPR